MIDKADAVVTFIAADVGTRARSPAVGNCHQGEGVAERTVGCQHALL